jgi:hypothetical protein
MVAGHGESAHTEGQGIGERAEPGRRGLDIAVLVQGRDKSGPYGW